MTPTPSSVAARPHTALHVNRNPPKYRRGDIWFIKGDPTSPPTGTELWSDRPGLIVSNNVILRSGFAQIIYLTTADKQTNPTHVDLGAPLSNGRHSTAMCEQIHTVDLSRLERKLGYVPAHRLVEVDCAIKFSLSIDEDADAFGAFKKWERYIQLHHIDLAQEIAALSARSTDERVTALSRALEAVTADRDAYRQLYENGLRIADLLVDVERALAPTSPCTATE